MSAAAAELKILGKGTYGCVTEPTIPCADGKPGYMDVVPGMPYVSKLYVNSKWDNKPDDAEKEYNNAQIMASIDPHHLFSVSSGGWCTPRLTPATRLQYTAACQVKPSREIGRQMYYENGGDNIENLRANGLFSTEEILRALTNILEGLVQMAAAGIVHMDIKSTNIVMDSTGRTRLIDFGFVRHWNDIVTQNDDLLVANGYEIWPPEWDLLPLYIYDFLTEKQGISESEAHVYVPPKDHQNIHLANQTLERSGGYHVAHGRAVKQMRDSFVGKHPMLRAKSVPEGITRILNNFKADFWNKLDVYSVGVTIARIAGTRLPPALHGRIKAWVLRATDPNAYTRFSPEEALAAYKTIWRDFPVTTISGAPPPDTLAALLAAASSSSSDASRDKKKPKLFASSESAAAAAAYSPVSTSPSLEFLLSPSPEFAVSPLSQYSVSPSPASTVSLSSIPIFQPGGRKLRRRSKTPKTKRSQNTRRKSLAPKQAARSRQASLKRSRPA
jgi:serine/threonine protein kinase